VDIETWRRFSVGFRTGKMLSSVEIFVQKVSADVKTGPERRASRVMPER